MKATLVIQFIFQTLIRKPGNNKDSLRLIDNIYIHMLLHSLYFLIKIEELLNDIYGIVYGCLLMCFMLMFLLMIIIGVCLIEYIFLSWFWIVYDLSTDVSCFTGVDQPEKVKERGLLRVLQWNAYTSF